MPATAPEGLDSAGDLEVPKIHPLLRGVAAAVAGGTLTFGTLAVFVANLEAGPVALLGVGLIFAIIAIAGQVPWRIKFGETEIELQKERRLRRRSEAAAVDLAGAVDPKEQPEAREVVERTQLSNPTLGSAMNSALGYEVTVIRMLEDILARRGGSWVPASSLLTSADLTTSFGSVPVLFDGLLSRPDNTRRALVEIKASTADIDPAFIDVLHDRFVRGVNQYGAEMLLFVTRDSLSRSAGMRIHEFSDMVWVKVNGPSDEANLDRGIERLLGKLYWETS